MLDFAFIQQKVFELVEDSSIEEGRKEFMKEDIRAGEAVLALDALWENIYEFETSISADYFNRFKECAELIEQYTGGQVSYAEPITLLNGMVQ